MARKPFVGWSIKAIGRPSTGLLVALFLFITVFQYAESFDKLAFLARVTTNLGLTRYTLERILYLLPIIWAGALFGWRGGIIASSIAVATMLPRDLLFSPKPEDALVETIAVFIVGNLAAFSLESLRKERQRRSELEAAQRELHSNLRVLEESEKRLDALNQTSAIVSQSLELAEVLDNAVACVMHVMGIEVVRIYILDEEAEELALATYRGVSKEFARGVSKLKIGEGYNGKVAQSGEPLFVEDAFEGERPTKAAVMKENIRSQLIVPMSSKGRVVGTLCVAVRSHRRFLSEEVELLTAISNQIGVAVENARLYQKEREVAEQLRSSEQRYRELFENAHDAIWLHDLEDNIIAANRACARLTGYDLKELRNLKTSELISEDSLENARSMKERLLEGEAPGILSELKLIKKDGTEAFIQLASSLLYGNGQPTTFQLVARDITEEKWMQENLRFFLKQVTRAQEEERRRIALELHDDTVQALVVHCQDIDDFASGAKGLQREAKLRLEGLHEQASNIMREVRRLSQDLRPAALDNLGLVPALEWLVSDVTGYSGIATKLKVLGVERRLPDEVELVLFRIAQEALRNVWKHAQANSAEITLEFAEGKTRVSVEDDGKGFDPPSIVSNLPRHGKLGLAGMQERASLLDGNLTIRSELGKGTTLTAELPI
ncbi:PAS domain S-box protein [Chloroflexota bacterium]